MKVNFVNIDKQRKIQLKEFQKYIGVKFKNPVLLNSALTHSSYAHEIMHSKAHNERLEFLGDSILSYIIVEYLFQNHCDMKEGELSKAKSYLVSENILYEIAVAVRIHQYVLLGKGEEITGGREKKSLISDTLEALIGACYLDQGLARTKKFVKKLFVEYLLNFDNINDVFDFKSQLQEYIQKKYRKNPAYSVIKEEGPEHKKVFDVVVKVDQEILGQGCGSNKKWAEKAAAKDALGKLNKSDINK